jgi:hypothetical protein
MYKTKVNTNHRISTSSEEKNASLCGDDRPKADETNVALFADAYISVPLHSENAHALSVAYLYHEAFSTPRDPRSAEYKAGVRAALAFHIEGKRIAHLYEAGTAQDDAYHAGIAEGHTAWRAASELVGGAA